MHEYTREELEEAQKKFSKGNPHHALLRNRL